MEIGKSDYIATWNKLCEEVKNAKRANLSEADFESKIYTFIQVWLEWSEKYSAIERQYEIKIGTTTVYSDIVLFYDGVAEIVLELKKPNHIKADKDITQLSSYMKALQCNFGLYLGEILELYYNNPIKKKSEPLGYKLYIVPGSSFVKKIVMENKFQAVLGVACHEDLNQVMMLLSDFCPQGVLLEKTGCFETKVNVKKVFEKIDSKY